MIKIAAILSIDGEDQKRNLPAQHPAGRQGLYMENTGTELTR